YACCAVDFFVLFFFSSRRRHTRFSRDWSSDVCSSDLQVQSALNKGNWTAIILTVVACWFLIQYMLPETINMKFFGEGYKEIARNNVFFATIVGLAVGGLIDRKSTRLNSSHVKNSYAVFCLKKK